MRWCSILILSVLAYGADRCDVPLPADVSSFYERKPVREQYQKLLEMHPDNLDYQYLQARSLVGSNTKEALRLYGQILAKDPDYPWVHLSQLQIYRANNAFRDREKLAASFATITRVCPALFDPYRELNELPSDDAAAQGARKLRAMLQAAQEPRDLRLYSTLWAVEFRVRPPAEQEDERKQVAEDLKRLLPFADDPKIRSAIQSGAKLIHDDALAQRMAPKPDAAQLVMQKSNAWLAEHPSPEQYGHDLLAQSEQWQKEAPDSLTGPYNRVQALIYLKAPAAEIAHAGDAFLDMLRREEYPTASWTIALAGLYMHGGVLLDRVPALVAESIREIDDPEHVIEIDLAPNPQLTAKNRQRDVSDRTDALLILAQTYQKQGELDKAHQTLWQASDYLASKAPASDETNKQVLNWYTISRHGVLRASAEIAEQEGRKIDALNGYREALAVRPLHREELIARQRKLWKELGGTDEGWQQWLNPVASLVAGPKPKEPATKPRPLPALSATDLEGGKWTLDRLANKTTIALVWATWCQPCRAELPYFAKLAERLKGRDGVQAISFNVDDNIALAKDFAVQNGYTFPVLAAKQYAEDLMPDFAVPRTWIIRNGSITEEHSGFGADGDKWVDDMLARLKLP